MKKTILKKRSEAVKRFLAGEDPKSICTSLRRSKAWLYKWIKRHNPEDPAWCQDQSKQPHISPHRTTKETEEIVKMVRLSLYNKDLFCGDQAILWELEDLQIQPLPSLRTINRILNRHGLTHRRTGRYEPKGKPYPELPALVPNQTHQMDLVGPCYLHGPIRFYSLNAVDVSINRCGIQPAPSRSSQSILDALWIVWKRMGIPENIQLDNDMAFYGSAAHPRGMGALIRLCLLHGVQPWFIPISEPWRNGVVEKFNDHYRQKFLDKIIITSEDELRKESLLYENKHNSTYRYSKLKGKTPLDALAHLGSNLVFPNGVQPPRHPLEKPKSGHYHLVRFIRSDLKLNIFGEFFPAPPETQYEYVVATVDVKEQKLKLYLNNNQAEEYEYRIK